MKKKLRMVCKKCKKVFIPTTYREKITGTCSNEECWVPTTDTDGIEYVIEDLFEYTFKCLKCGEKIHTNNKKERLCKKCRNKNKKVFIYPYEK